MNSPTQTQPTAAAMRAAEDIHPEFTVDWWLTVAHKSLRYQNLFAQACEKREHIAQIIDRETQADVAELREALEAMVNSIAPDLEYAITEAIRHGKRVTTYTQAKIDALDKARAVLARHANPAK